MAEPTEATPPAFPLQPAPTSCVWCPQLIAALTPAGDVCAAHAVEAVALAQGSLIPADPRLGDRRIERWWL